MRELIYALDARQAPEYIRREAERVLVHVLESLETREAYQIVEQVWAHVYSSNAR